MAKAKHHILLLHFVTKGSVENILSLYPYQVISMFFIFALIKFSWCHTGPFFLAVLPNSWLFWASKKAVASH